MRYLKIFNNKDERDEAVSKEELSPNSVSIWGSNSDNDGIQIEYGVGNGSHEIELGINDLNEKDTVESDDND